MILVFFPGTSVDEIKQEATNYLCDLNRCLDINKKQLNAAKTNYMLFTPKNKKIYKLPCLTTNNCITDRITDCKFLGVWFNDKLSWTTQTERMKSDLSRTVGIIYKTVMFNLCRALASDQ